MADRYLLESGAPDGYLLEDGSGVLLLEGDAPSTFCDYDFAADTYDNASDAYDCGAIATGGASHHPDRPPLRRPRPLPADEADDETVVMVAILRQRFRL